MKSIHSLKRLSNSPDNGIGIIYITHRFSEIFELSHSVAVLRDGKDFGQGPIADFSYKRLLEGLVSTSEQQIYLKKMNKTTYAKEN